MDGSGVCGGRRWKFVSADGDILKGIFCRLLCEYDSSLFLAIQRSFVDNFQPTQDDDRYPINNLLCTNNDRKASQESINTTAKMEYSQMRTATLRTVFASAYLVRLYLVLKAMICKCCTPYVLL